MELPPVLKRALANQHQAILLAAAAALSLATVSPLPLLVLLGGEVIALPFLFERLQRRLEAERQASAREEETLSQAERYDQLTAEGKSRFDALQRLCRQIQGNYVGLSDLSRGIVAGYDQKFEAILATCLRRLWLVQKYEGMIRAFDAGKVQAEIERLQHALTAKDVTPRVSEAWQQNLEIKQKLLAAAERNLANRTALLAELDSLESLLQLMLQKSLAATDARAFSAEMDDMLAQTELDAQSVQEMESLAGAMPEMAAAPTFSERVRERMGSPPPPPPPPRSSTRSRG